MPSFRFSGPAAALVIAVLVHLAGMLLIKGFGTTFGIRAMLVLASLLAIASIGQTLAILLGGIDLSIPFVIGFANVAAAQLYAQGVPFAFVLPGVIFTAMARGRPQRRAFVPFRGPSADRDTRHRHGTPGHGAALDARLPDRRRPALGPKVCIDRRQLRPAAIPAPGPIHAVVGRL